MKKNIIIFSMFVFSVLFTACYSTPQPTRPTFTIVNNTGRTIVGLYISPVANVSWGQNWLNRAKPNGNSTSWFLTEAQLAGGGFDLRLIDSNGFTYTRANYRISPNSRFVFTMSHADDRFIQDQRNFIPYFLWTTGANQPNSGIRSINIAATRAEILRLFKLYNYIRFHPDSYEFYDTRANYQAMINRRYHNVSNMPLRRHYSWVRHWLNNNNNQFAFAHVTVLPHTRLVEGRFRFYRNINVTIVNGDEMVTVVFSNFAQNNIDILGINRRNYPTGENNRRWLVDNILDPFLN